MLCTAGGLRHREGLRCKLCLPDGHPPVHGRLLQGGCGLLKVGEPPGKRSWLRRASQEFSYLPRAAVQKRCDAGGACDAAANCSCPSSTPICDGGKCKVGCLEGAAPHNALSLAANAACGPMAQQTVLDWHIWPKLPLLLTTACSALHLHAANLCAWDGMLLQLRLPRRHPQMRQRHLQAAVRLHLLLKLRLPIRLAGL